MSSEPSGGSQFRQDEETPSERTQKPEEKSSDAKEPGLLKRVRKKAGIDVPTFMLMIKGALPPIIALAAYQGDAFANQYTTLGYLIAIMSLLGMAIQPRAKFLQAMATSLIFTCVGAAVALLQIQCAVAARRSTSLPVQPTATGSSGSTQSVQYNAAASTVAAVWMFFTIFVANLLKAYRPQMMVPIIQYCIFTLVASIYAGSFPNMTAGESFAKRLLITFLTGFAIATGVSLFILPMTSRGIATKQMGGLLGLMKLALATHGSYMSGISESHRVPPSKENDHKDKEKKKKAKQAPSGQDARVKALKENLVATAGLFSKIKLEIAFAKKEIAWGKLCPEDYSAIFTHLQEILLPVIGMSTFIDIMQSVKTRKEQHSDLIDSEETLEAIRQLEADEWDEVISMSHDAFVVFKAALMGGLSHASYVLEMAPKPKAPKGDVEKNAQTNPSPGDARYSDFLEKQVQSFQTHRQQAIKDWCERKGVDLPSSFWDDPAAEQSFKDRKSTTDTAIRAHKQQQLYLVLYLGYLVHSMGKAILKLARYADSKVEDGTMTKKRFIFPGWRRIRKLVEGNFRKVDSENEMNDGDHAGTSIWVGDSLKTRKDPEHLPPANAYEKFTNKLRKFPRIMASPEASFAFRAAVAAMSLGVLAFLRQTHTFFLEQRGVWALIMTAISMDSHAGRGVFGFLARICGTAVASVASIAIWYIGDHHPAAIIPVFYIYLMMGIWFLLKNPQLAIVAIISMVTAVLVLGYELQELKIGLQLTESNGQAYYAIYLLAPYRLATVCAGLLVAFVWTYFPYPVTTHSTLRKDMGSTLYLMANYYSCVHTTVETRLKYGARAKEAVKGSPLYKLDKARRKVFGKMIVMMSKLREHSNFTRFELKVGGKFDKATYDDLISSMQRMFNYMSLISYSTNAFTTEPEAEESAWLQDFRRFTSELKITSHQMTSALCLVSASVTNGQPLPPYLQIPAPFALADRMESVDPEILSIKHVNEPCYAAFAVLEVASSLITEELAHVVKKVQDLVGEVDFSFHVISTSSDSSSINSTLFDENGNYDKGKKD